MFYCTGENDEVSCSRGVGTSELDAIKNWSTHEDWDSICEEFNQYAPTIIEGRAIEITIEIPPPIIKRI